MVLRIKKRSRKYLGNRTWGAGNIKNKRGAGDRGGVGKAGRGHKWTHIVVYERDRIGKRGFYRSKKQSKVLMGINLGQIAEKLKKEKNAKQEIELSGYKVLGSGSLAFPIVIKASGFSKNAIEKINKIGGKAIVLSNEPKQQEQGPAKLGA
ncbi:MAG: uL15m family ribosomal protein [Candidatus Micrarchaeia archaeon]